MHSKHDGLMLAQRLRRWPNMKTSMFQHGVLAGAQHVEICLMLCSAKQILPFDTAMINCLFIERGTATHYWFAAGSMSQMVGYH